MNPDPSDFDPDKVPEHIQELCAACVQYVMLATGVALDFTPDTLPVLDHYLRGVRDAKIDVKALVSPAAGAYFGETVRRLYPARWHAPEGDDALWRVEFVRCFLHFNPVHFAREAIEGTDVVDGGAGFGVRDEDLGALRDGLAVFGEVPEDEYYALSTRLEALGPVVDRLSASALARTSTVPEYSEYFYAEALDDDDGPQA